MRLFIVAAVAVLAGSGLAFSGENMQLADGMRYCPAPWCDNSDFENSYFAVDAKTGKMYKLSGNGITSEEEIGVAAAQEEVLFVAPPISVENIYVPNPDPRHRPQFGRASPATPGMVAAQPAQPVRRQGSVAR